MVHCYLDLCRGNKDKFDRQQLAYDAACTLLTENPSLPQRPEYLSPDQQRSLEKTNAQKNAEKVASRSFLANAFGSKKPKPLAFQPPTADPAFSTARLTFVLYDTDVPRASENFRKLCTGEAGMCRNAPKKRLWYKGNRIHRIVQGYIAQGGDVTKGDGIGGDSIYGGKFADEPAGLTRRPKMGTLAMANAGPNSNTSQFFVVLTDAPAQLERIAGKYVVFGEVVDGWDVLRRLDRNGTHDGFPMQATWIGDCGVL